MKLFELFSDRRAGARPVWDAVYEAFKAEAVKLRRAGVDVKLAKNWSEKTGNLENKWAYVLVLTGDVKEEVQESFNNIVEAGKKVGSRVKLADTIAVFGTSGKPTSSAELESITMDYEKTRDGYWLGIKFNDRK